MELTELYDSIARSDIVVVNGEGTLHGMRRPPKNLLYLMWASAHRLRKPTFLVNHSLFPADRSPNINKEAIDIYKSAIQHLSGIAVREKMSRDIYELMDIEAVQAFDMLPIFANLLGVRAPQRSNDSGDIVLGLGVGFTPAQACSLASIAKRYVPATAPLVLLNGGPRQDPVEERTLPEIMMRIEPRIRLAEEPACTGYADDIRARKWLETIANARLIITGRYHHVVAALYFGTPVIAMASHTPKIEGTFKLVGIEHKAIDPHGDDWEEHVGEAIDRALAGDVAKVDSEQQSMILRLAYANAIWRPGL
jgi:polysaccharide pyruvyl transferase WcaK-like protein